MYWERHIISITLLPKNVWRRSKEEKTLDKTKLGDRLQNNHFSLKNVNSWTIKIIYRQWARFRGSVQDQVS